MGRTGAVQENGLPARAPWQPRCSVVISSCC